MSFSYSRVNTHHECAYLYKLRYVDRLEEIEDQSPNNALYEGTSIHEGIENRSIEKAIESYKSHYSTITKENEAEIFKLQTILPKAIRDVPEGEYEFKISWQDGFVGYADLLVKVEDGIYDLYDFKFSNNVGNYKRSAQLHIYKYYYEKMTGNSIRNMYFVFIPKYTNTLTEGLEYKEFEQKVLEYYSDKEIQFEKIDYNPQQVNFFFARKAMMDKSDKLGIYEKRFSPTCKWCPFKKYCESNGQDTSELKKKITEVKETNLWNQ